MTKPPDVSIVVLLEEDAPDFHAYIGTLQRLFRRRGLAFEIVIIANGLEGFLKSELARHPNDWSHIKAFAFPSRVAQAVCVRAALKETRAEVMVMCGSYQQITEAAFETLLDAFDAQTDLVSPWRQGRVDPSFNQLQSRLFNAIVNTVTGTRLHDLSCITRVLRREILEQIRIYGNMYRFLPILAQRKGFRVKEVPCEHFQERGRTGFYRMSEYLERLVDIGNLYFNTRFSRKPLRFFSTLGAFFLVTGLLIGLWTVALKIFAGEPLGNSPELLTAVVFMVVGVQTAGLGLLGEIIAFTHGRQRKEYTIAKII